MAPPPAGRLRFLSSGLACAALLVPAGTPAAASTLPPSGAADRSPATTQVRTLSLSGPLTSARRTAPFSTVGVTWPATGSAPRVDAAVRTRTAQGWTRWRELDGHDVTSRPLGGLVPEDVDAGTRAGTEPLYVGRSTGLQVRVDGAPGQQPDPWPEGLRVALVRAGAARAADSAPVAPLTPTLPRPTIRTRAEWGADETQRNGFAGYGTTIRAAFVHHTVTPNGYTRGEVPSIIRGIYAYHTQALGWSDIGTTSSSTASAECGRAGGAAPSCR